MSENRGLALAPRRESLHGAVLVKFAETWKSRYGVSYIPSPGDHRQLKLLLARVPREELATLPAAFERYLADEGPFVMREMRHSLTYFCTSNALNKYRGPEVLVTTQREVDNRRAGAQWLALTDQGNGHGRR